MLNSFKLLIAAGVVSLMATSAHAVTFESSVPNPLDFGEVSVGDTKTIGWNISWLLGHEENLASSPTFTIGNVPNTDYNAMYKGCVSAENKCSIVVQFTPSTLGQSTLENLVQLNLLISSGSSAVDEVTYSYSLNTTGVGINPVPLPAAFPLLAGALSLLGFLGWRRKRMAVA